MAVGLCPLALALAAVLTPLAAAAYPTSVVFAPSGEALPRGSFSLGTYVGMRMAPRPVRLASVWGGLNVGLLPSIKAVTTPAGRLAFGGAEVGFDVFGPDTDGAPAVVLNAKLQLLKEARYWPALAIGGFQISPDLQSGPLLGYFSLSKSLTVGPIELGQLTFGMMRSFASSRRIAPQCLAPGAPTCVFRGSAPFADENGALIAGYSSPWFGPIGFSADYVGGTSSVSSSNFFLRFRVWQDGAGGLALFGVGGFIANDRRPSPPGPGAEDGLFANVALVTSLRALLGRRCSAALARRSPGSAWRQSGAPTPHASRRCEGRGGPRPRAGAASP